MALNYEENKEVVGTTGQASSGIYINKYGIENQILANVEHQWSVGVVVDQSVGVDVGIKKIAKAGTPITGSLDERTTPFTKADSTALGVLLHDVDVTLGHNNGTMLIFGFVNTNRLQDDVKELLNTNIKNSLNMIKFLAC